MVIAFLKWKNVLRLTRPNLRTAVMQLTMTNFMDKLTCGFLVFVFLSHDGTATDILASSAGPT